jgi:DNA replication and repair protein RecF
LYVERIQLVNFRNYRDEDLAFSPGINVFVGNNAQGKTNLLESVHVLSTSRSHRAFSDRDLILWGENAFAIAGTVSTRSIRHQIRIRYDKDTGKDVEIDGKRVYRSSELTQVLAVIVFSPEDLQVVKGSPGMRRRFLDSELIQVDPAYRHAYREYTKALQHRNSILKGPSMTHQGLGSSLAVWDEQLATHGAKLIQLRREAIKELRALSSDTYRAVSGGREELELVYTTSFPSGEASDEAATKDAFLSALAKTRGESLSRGSTVVGPHRDDLAIYVGGQDLRSFGSQGQQRIAVLAMKMAMLEFVERCIDDRPVLLLDDVMSELDEKRRKYLLSVVSNRIQTFITTTSPDIGSAISDSPAVYRVENGRATRC